jgi:hypothetical protein
MSNGSLNHNEYLEQIAAYVTGGLDAAERAAFEAHLATCESCSAALAEAAQADRSLVDLFADARPAVGFEDRLIQRLRLSPASRMMLHPAVWRAASGLAAALILGSVGYSANRLIENNKLPFAETIAFVTGPAAKVQTAYPGDETDLESHLASRVRAASNLRQIGQGLVLRSGRNVNGQEGDTASRGDQTGVGQQQAYVSDLEAVTEQKGLFNPIIDSKSSERTEKVAESLKKRVDPQGVRNITWRDANANGVDQLGRGLSRKSQETLGETRHKLPEVHFEAQEGKQLSETWAAYKVRAPAQEKNVTTLGVTAGADGLAGAGGLGNNATQYLYFRAAGDSAAKLHDFGIAPGYIAVDKLAGKPMLLAGTEARKSEVEFFKPEALSFGVNVQRGGDSKKDGKQVDELRISEAEAKFDPTLFAEPDLKQLRQAAAGQQAVESKPKPYLDIMAYPKDWAEVAENRERLGEIPAPSLEKLSTGRSQVQLPTNTSTAGVLVQAANPTPQTPPVVEQPAMTRKIVRNGEMEFEVEGFDSAYVQISRIVIEEGGYVSSTNSEKLPNGKVRGTVAVRVPPDRLDTLVLKLRALGDLKSQKISAQDVTKQYFDLEGELKAARAMEERVLNIIKSGKGEIKDLLAAEVQLGVYREKIEKLEGEIRYYNNLISLSTLSITAYERDIRTPAFASLTEQVGMGIETEDVEKARTDALKAIEEAKGRLLESNLKKYDAGQLAATIRCEVSPDAAGALIDRLRQLGRVARLDIDRKQTTPEGTSAAAGARVEKKDTRFSISLYNLANIAARQTTNMNMAVSSVEDSYKGILDSVKARKGRVITSSLNRQKPEQTTATISFEVAAADADAVLAEIRREREVMMLTVTENPDTNNVTAAKRGFSVQLFSLASVAPRETEQVVLAAKTAVGESLQKLLAEVKKADGRIMVSQLNEQDPSNVSGSLDIEVMRAKEIDVRQALSAAGDIISRNVNRSTDADNTVDSKVRLQIRLVGFEQLPPLETTRLTVEVSDVDKASNDLRSAIAAAGGRVLDLRHADDHSGQVTTHVLANMPLAQAPAIISQLKNMGKAATEFSRNPQAPAGEVARAQIDVTIASVGPIVGRDQGLSAALKSALSTSVFGLLWSVRLIVIGLLFAGPWALLLWGGWKFLRRTPAKTPGPIIGNERTEEYLGA